MKYPFRHASRKSNLSTVGVPGPASVLFRESRLKKELGELLEQGRNSKSARDPSRKISMAILGGFDICQCEVCHAYLKRKDQSKHHKDKCMNYYLVLPKHGNDYICMLGCPLKTPHRINMMKHLSDNHS